MKYIDKIGVEIEGGWFYDNFSSFWTKQDDGSVYIGHDDDEDDENYYHIGEIISYPTRDLLMLLHQIKDNYPDKTNHTCGLHIHTSFKSKLMYAHLMEFSFYEFFIERWKAWGEGRVKKYTSFWKRLDGENEYCQIAHRPDCQVTYKCKKDRYTQLNYCYSLHQTIENRLLPAFQNVDLSLSAIEEYVSIIDDYLDVCPKRDTRIEETLMDFHAEEKKEKIIIPVTGEKEGYKLCV